MLSVASRKHLKLVESMNSICLLSDVPCLSDGADLLSKHFFPLFIHSSGSISDVSSYELNENEKKKKLIFITGLHNKPLGCVASVTSSAGPFTKKKKKKKVNKDGDTPPLHFLCLALNCDVVTLTVTFSAVIKVLYFSAVLQCFDHNIYLTQRCTYSQA
jgi:hypothetical protein